MELEGNVALVTGAASGLGEASMRRFVARGARVVMCDLNEERAAKITDELGDRVVFVKTDVRSEDDVLAALGAAEGLGELVATVHCAGARSSTPRRSPPWRGRSARSPTARRRPAWSA
jgi:NAD(P)-dependent dehydrogenase (short-subunit alcohol dehydrogenase family)